MRRTRRVCGEFRVGTWNTQGLACKKNEVRKSLEDMGTDVVLLQETMARETVFLEGFTTAAQPAEDGPGKQGVCIAAREGLGLKKIGGHTEYFVFGEIKDLTGKLTVGSVYIPIGREVETVAELGRRVDKMAGGGRRIVLGGDWNMKKEDLAKALKKWNCAPQLVEKKGSPLTRHGRKRDKSTWTEIDYFVTVGHLGGRKARVNRSYPASDHWPVCLTVVVPVEKRSVEANILGTLPLSRMAIRAKEREIATHPTWLETEPTIAGLRGTAQLIASHLGLWCKPREEKGLSLSKETKNALETTRELKRRQIDGKPLSAKETETLKLMKKEVRARSANDTRKRIHRWREKIADDAARGDGKAIWKLIGVRKKRHGHEIQPVVDKNGETQVTEQEVDKVWAEHWSSLYESSHPWEGHATQIDATESEDEFLTRQIGGEELDEALMKLKNWKSASGEGIPPEFFKTAEPGTLFFEFLLKTFNAVWEEGEFPSEWNTADVVCIHKKGPKTDPENYRAISLIPVSLKIANGIFARRIAARLEEKGAIREEQAGFRRGEECIGHVVALEEIKARRKNQETLLCFVDLKKAFDLVPQEALLSKVQKALGSGRMYRYLRNMYMNPRARMQGGETHWKCSTGVRQGCPISPILFNIFINDALEGKEEWGVTVPGMKIKVHVLLFADDVVLLSETREDLQKLLSEMENWTSVWGMQINAKKCAAILGEGESGLRACGEEIQNVSAFKYLGIWIGERELDVRAERRGGDMIIRELGRTLRNPHVPLKHKSLVIKGLILPRIMYGTEITGTTIRATKEKQRVLNRALSLIAGSGMVLKALSNELGVPSAKQDAIKRQWRALETLPNKKTVVKHLQDGSGGRYAWRNRSAREYKRALKKLPKTPDNKHELGRLTTQVELESLKKGTGERYRELHGMHNLIMKLSAEHQNHGKGWRQTLRLLCGNLWTVPRLAKAGFVRADAAESCPGCKENIKETEEHLLFSCSAHADARKRLTEEMGIRLPGDTTGLHPLVSLRGLNTSEERILVWVARMLEAIEPRRRVSLREITITIRGRPLQDGGHQ